MVLLNRVIEFGRRTLGIKSTLILSLFLWFQIIAAERAPPKIDLSAEPRQNLPK